MLKRDMFDIVTKEKRNKKFLSKLRQKKNIKILRKFDHKVGADNTINEIEQIVDKYRRILKMLRRKIVKIK